MEKDELIKLWSTELDKMIDKAADELDRKAAIRDVLIKVFDVGFETGKGAEKLERQLNKLGEPHGYSNVG